MQEPPAAQSRHAVAALRAEVYDDSQAEARTHGDSVADAKWPVWQFQNPVCDPYRPPTRRLAVVRDPATQYALGKVPFRAATEPGS